LPSLRGTASAASVALGQEIAGASFGGHTDLAVERAEARVLIDALERYDVE
jgi:hypothetical protein